MKKKILSIILAGAMICSLSACGAYETDEADATASGTEAEEPADGTAETEGGETAATGKKIFRYSETLEPTTLDPSKADSILDNELIHAS